MDEGVCAGYVYSEKYYNFLIKYDRDIESVERVLKPECINIINNQFLVAYKRLEDGEDIYLYGYNAVPKCYGLMDTTAVEAIGATAVSNLPGLNLKGREVLIGFVDTGIEYTNPLFINRDGTTRIEYIWDQNQEVEGDGNKVFGFGAEFSREDINEAIKTDSPYDLVPTTDSNGHGTFLASVAAGGEDTNNNFTGVAPESKLIVVKLKEAKSNLKEAMLINEDAVCYSEDDIMLGIKYLINKAVILDRPLVICLGLGTSQGDHNGNTNLEIYLNTLSNLRGVCVVSPVGNELGTGIHFSGNNRINMSEAFEDMEISVGEEDRGFVMELWGNAPGLLSVEVLSPTGERISGGNPVRDNREELQFVFEGSRVVIDNYVVDSYSGDQLVVLKFINPTSGIWTVRVRETSGIIGGGFDAWLPIQEFRNSRTIFVRSDPNVTICSPGNGEGGITVAGYNHTNNALYVNSGRGYTRKGRIKPDVTAPSVEVYGAFAIGRRVREESLFTTRSGSSVGAALTAGGVALIMEWGLVDGNNPGMSLQVIKQMLIRGTDKVADTEYPNPSWGWGVVDILGSFDVIRNS